MGIYYRGISKRVATVNGANILFTNFFGKPPLAFAENTGRWDAFITRSTNTARLLEHTAYTYVTSAKNWEEIRKYGEVAVAVWKGQAVMDDLFWDKNTIGSIRKVNGNWRFKQAEA